ncbi:MAG: hypothetical protein K9H14_01470 [Actinomycetia bacterium]|nr:hypothetical protein [Actinomycetes bacterium]
MKNKYKKLVPFLDRFPFIIFVLVAGIAIIIFLVVNSSLNLSLFNAQLPVEEEEQSYDVYITSPNDGDVYDFINQNETVPIEIKARQIESQNFEVNVLVNDQIIKTFASPPYEFNWNPQQGGEYQLLIQVIDKQDQTVAVSSQISFLVNYEQAPDEEKIISEDIEEKKTRILANSQYRKQNDASGKPIFSYKAYTPPLIDASIEEWELYEKFSNFVPTIKKENYTSHTDVNGTFYSCWDEENFYFAIQIIDDVFSQSYTGDQLNNGDSVVIVIDTNLVGDLQTQFLNNDDYQIEFSPGNFGQIPAEAFMRWPTNAAPQSTEISSARLSSGYLIEASIPWYNFTNYTPADEDILGFTVSILDTDNLESTELVISSSNQFDFNNVFTLGNLVLIDAGDLLEEEQQEDSEQVQQ